VLWWTARPVRDMPIAEMKSQLEPEDFVLEVPCSAQNCHMGFVPGGKKCSLCYGKGMIQTRLGTHLTGVVMDALFRACECVATKATSCRKCRGRKVVLTPIGELLCSFVRQQLNEKSPVDSTAVVSKGAAETKATVATNGHAKASEGAKAVQSAAPNIPDRKPVVHPVPETVNGSASHKRPGPVSQRRDLVDVRLP